MITCLRAFKEHPAEAGENYWQHLRFTLLMAARLIAVGGMLLIHGLLPFLFCKTSSKECDKINRTIQARMGK